MIRWWIEIRNPATKDKMNEAHDLLNDKMINHISISPKPFVFHNIVALYVSVEWLHYLSSPRGIDWADLWQSCHIHHDGVIKWKHVPLYLSLVRGIHRSPVNSPHKGQWRGTLMFSLICALNKRLSKQSWGWWFETPSRSLWRHGNNDRHFVMYGCMTLHKPNNFLFTVSRTLFYMYSIKWRVCNPQVAIYMLPLRIPKGHQEHWGIT